jgi:hypothetical protein
MSASRRRRGNGLLSYRLREFGKGKAAAMSKEGENASKSSTNVWQGPLGGIAIYAAI